MSKRRYLIAACLSLCIAGLLCLVGCGGGATNSMDPVKFQLGDHMEVTAANDQVVWDEEAKADVVTFDIEATNISDEDWSWNQTANVNVKQNDQALSTTNLCALDDASKTMAPGDTVNLTFAYKLADHSAPVNVSIGGYTSTVESTEFTIEVADRQTEESKTAESDAEAEVAEKKTASEADMSGATATLADGFYFDSSDDSGCKLVKDEHSGYIEVSCTNSDKSASEEAERIAGNYSEPLEVQTTTVNGTEYSYIQPTEDQFIMFAKTSDDSQCVKISGMFYSMDEAMPQLKAITIK